MGVRSETYSFFSTSVSVLLSILLLSALLKKQCARWANEIAMQSSFKEAHHALVCCCCFYLDNLIYLFFDNRRTSTKPSCVWVFCRNWTVMNITHRLFYIYTYKSCVGFILISEQLHNCSNIPIGTEGLSLFFLSGRNHSFEGYGRRIYYNLLKGTF